MSRCGCLATCVYVFACIIIKIGATQNDCTTPIEGQEMDHHLHPNETGVAYHLPFEINNKCEFNITFENGTKLSESQYLLKNIPDFQKKPKFVLFFPNILQGKFRMQFSDGTTKHLYFYCEHEVCQESYEQTASVSKTIFNYYPKTVSFKLDVDADFQKCFHEHGCYVEDPYGSTECNNVTKTLKFSETLVNNINVTIRCYEKIPWSLKIKIELVDISLTSIILLCKLLIGFTSFLAIFLRYFLWHDFLTKIL